MRLWVGVLLPVEVGGKGDMDEAALDVVVVGGWVVGW